MATDKPTQAQRGPGPAAERRVIVPQHAGWHRISLQRPAAGADARREPAAASRARTARPPRPHPRPLPQSASSAQQAHEGAAPQWGVGDPSAGRLQLANKAYVGRSSRSYLAKEPQRKTGLAPGLLRSCGNKSGAALGTPLRLSRGRRSARGEPPPASDAAPSPSQTGARTARRRSRHPGPPPAPAPTPKSWSP